jgi:hypothetical protein
MLRYAALVVVVAAVGPENARGDENRKPSVGVALERTKVIAFGQIEKLERRRGRTIATMQVEHLARGSVPPLLTYLVNLGAGFEPNPKVGDRELVFLEPSEAPEVSLQIASGGAVLAAFQIAGEIYVAEGELGGLRLPPGLCERGVRRPSYACVARLSLVLGYLNLPPYFPKDKQPATFRIASQECAPCELAPWMEKSSTQGATDCGSTSLRDKSSKPMACVRYALGARKPFRAVFQLQGTDTFAWRGYVSDGITTFELTYVRELIGGNSCAARVERRRCRSVEAQDPRIGEGLECVEPRESEVLCAQSGEYVDSLGPPRSVGDLRCDKGYPGGTFLDCAVRPGSPKGSKAIPSGAGPNLICKQFGDLVERLTCQPE